MNLFKNYFFIYGLAGSPLLSGLSLVAVSGGYSSVAVRRPLIAVASPAAERGLWSRQVSAVADPGLKHRLSSCGHRLGCPAARGIFLAQGLNPCPLAWVGRLLTPVPPGKFPTS